MQKRGNVLAHPRKNYRRWNKSKLVMLLGACLLVFLLFLFGLYTYKINELQAEQEYYQEKEKQYLEKGEQLEKEVEKLQCDEYIEDLARQKLGLIKPEEKVILLED